MIKPVWETPKLRTIDLVQVEGLADLDMAFTTVCTIECIDFV